MQESYDHYFEEESLYQAINRFEDMIKSNATCYFDVCEFEIIIDYYLDQHNFRIAEEAIGVGISQHPGAYEIKFRLAQFYIQSGKPAKGLRILRNIENIEATNSDFYLLKGSALNILGKSEEARQAFDEAIKNAAENKDDIIYNIAYSYINARSYNIALKYLELAYEVNPLNITVIQEIALVCERMDKLDKCVDFYNRYLEIDPFNDSIWLSLGIVYSSMNKIEKALEAYEYAIAIRPEGVSALFSKANCLVNIGDNKEAIIAYNEILDLEPDNVQALTYIGECYEKMTFYKRSEYYFKRAIELDETFSDAWYGLGIANYQQDNYSEALKYFIKANQIDPENADFWFMLGEVYREMSILEKSAESYNRVLELDPNDYEAWITRAELSFKDNNDLKGAIRIMAKAFEYNPDISLINYQLATYYFFNNQSKQAIHHFERGLDINFVEHIDFLDALPKKTARQLNPILNKYKKKSN